MEIIQPEVVMETEQVMAIHMEHHQLVMIIENVMHQVMLTEVI